MVPKKVSAKMFSCPSGSAAAGGNVTIVGNVATNKFAEMF